MKISAINSNYEAKKSLKKNQKNNANMTTPSFEGMNKLNKVSAKKLALALMAGIAVTTPSLQSCATMQSVVSESSTQNNLGKNDFYINPDVAKKYPEINPAEHKSFDLNQEKYWMSTTYDTPLYYMHNSLDAQLLNYYIQNPQEKNLPNNEIIQSFVDNYNQTKASSMKEATLKDTKDVLNLYKKIAKKYKVSEQEAVWNCPTPARSHYQLWLGFSSDKYYEKNNYFMNPSSENRKKIQDYIINYDGSESDDFEKNIIENIKEFSPEVIDEIHKRAINSCIHWKMRYSSSRGSDYSKYIDIFTIYINPKVAEKYPEINPAEHNNFDLYEPDIIGNKWIIEKRKNILDVGSDTCLFGNSLDAQLLDYYIKNPQERELPKDKEIHSFVDNYNKNKEYSTRKATYEQAEEILNLYREISQKFNVSEQDAVWNCPSLARELYQHRVYDCENTHYKKNNHFINPTSENRENIQYYIISHNGNKNDDFERNVVEDIKEFSPEVIDEINKREVNTLIHSKMVDSSTTQGSDYNKYLGEYIETAEDKLIKEKEIERKALIKADEVASSKAKELATQKASDAALAKAKEEALAKAKEEAHKRAYESAKKTAKQNADKIAEQNALAKAQEKATALAEASGRVKTATAEATYTASYTAKYTHYATETATKTASATVTTEKINKNPTKNITETVTVSKSATESYTAEETATATSTYSATVTVVPKVIRELQLQKSETQARISTINLDIIDIKSKISDKTYKISNNKSQIIYYENQLKQAEKRLIEYKAECERKKNDPSVRYSSFLSTLNLVNSTESSIERYEQKLRNYKTENINLEAEIQIAQSDLYFKSLDLLQAEQELQRIINELNKHQ